MVHTGVVNPPTMPPMQPEKFQKRLQAFARAMSSRKFWLLRDAQRGQAILSLTKDYIRVQAGFEVMLALHKEFDGLLARYQDGLRGLMLL
jgi:hypothetical protein